MVGEKPNAKQPALLMDKTTYNLSLYFLSQFIFTVDQTQGHRTKCRLHFIIGRYPLLRSYILCLDLKSTVDEKT